MQNKQTFFNFDDVSDPSVQDATEEEVANARDEFDRLSDMFMRSQRIAQEWAGLEALKITFNPAQPDD